MDQIGICEQLNEGLGALFTCSDYQSYQRIRTPYFYPVAGAMASGASKEMEINLMNVPRASLEELLVTYAGVQVCRCAEGMPVPVANLSLSDLAVIEGG